MITALISLGVMIFLIAAIIISWPFVIRYFMKKYYQESYEPIHLEEGNLQDFPLKFHLSDVPWITSALPLSQSTSLQMIAAQHAIQYPRANFDFLMGYTYGTSNMPVIGFTPLGTDPEMGLLTAAPYLGLKRCYYVTSNERLFLSALRTFISQGFPVRLALDEGILYDAKQSIPHSEVLVGFDAHGFYYYEPVAAPPSDTAVGERAPGEQGLYVSDEKLLTSVRSISTELKYPWWYALTIFEQGPLKEDLSSVWELLGKAMAEEIKYGPRMGAKVIENIGVQIQHEGPAADLSKMQAGVSLAAEVRRDDAEFLLNTFGYEKDIKEAAELIKEAASHYQSVVDEIEDGIASQAEAKRVANHLFDAASNERKAGEIFLKRANQ